MLSLLFWALFPLVQKCISGTVRKDQNSKMSQSDELAQLVVSLLVDLSGVMKMFLRDSTLKQTHEIHNFSIVENKL